MKKGVSVGFILVWLLPKLGQCAGMVIKERQVLEELKHPFICNLRYAFQDVKHCFFVLDLLMGGSVGCESAHDMQRPLNPLLIHLPVHLSRRKVITEGMARYWIAEIATAISYLHSKGIMHR